MAVKVNISPKPKNESEPEYIYHWDRIGFVILAMLAICIGLWFGFSSWSQKHGSASLKPTSVITEQPKFETSLEPQPTQAALTPLTSVKETQPALKTSPKMTKAEPEVIKASEKAEPETTKLETASLNTKTEQTKPQQQAANYQQLDFIEKKTQILDESVTRYVTAAGVKDREPVGSLDTLTHRKGGMARVYVFADVQNFKGETIQYHWYQNDNLLAKVDIEVKGNRWRNKTFQTIGPAMTGTWRVELMFGDITLARTEFLVKRIDN